MSEPAVPTSQPVWLIVHHDGVPCECPRPPDWFDILIRGHAEALAMRRDMQSAYDYCSMGPHFVVEYLPAPRIGRTEYYVAHKDNTPCLVGGVLEVRYASKLEAHRQANLSDQPTNVRNDLHCPRGPHTVAKFELPEEPR